MMTTAERQIHPWQPISLLPEAVPVFNRLAASRLVFGVTVPVGEVTLRLVPPLPFSADRWIALSGESGSFHLGMTKAGLDNLVAPVSGGIPLNDLTAELATAVVAAALEPWLTVWAQHFYPLKVEDLCEIDPGPDQGYFLFQRRERETWQDWAALAADASACRWLERILANLPPPPSNGRLRELPIPLSLVLGQMPLPSGELTGIQVGDILLPPLSEPLRVRLENTVDRRQLGSGRIEEHACIIEEWKVTSMNKEETLLESPQETPLDSLESLEAEVSFELERLPLSIQQLRELAPGAVLALDTDPKAPVTIRINRRLAGRGEIVRIGDRLGVRVTAWLEEGEP